MYNCSVRLIMLQWLLLTVAALSQVMTSAEQPVPSAGIAARLAAACSHGVQRAVEHEAGGAVHQDLSTVHQVPTISESLRQVLPQLLLAPEDCPAGWARHEDSCYFIPPRTTTWYMAHHACSVIDRRARLASLHPGSAAFLQQMVAEFNASKAVWIGLARQDTQSDWLWSDGSPMDYINRWDSGEPTGAQERCVHMGWTNRPKSRFHDNQCSVIVNLLCQINLK